ncbi:hypothetical protein [uncultured Sphaerochaeta sp.]|uniref:phage head completion protein n=1 Tax=uncultured Sphaerochaeta sp. TaxID=886478 RepID=UPI002A0A234D|nr:hypothetical protein [uncultured Sphaerochaeta sp.]
MSFESRLDKTANILRKTPATGAWGSVDSLDKIGEVLCRIQSSSGREYTNGKIRTEATHMVFMDKTDLLTSDILEIEGTRYEVIPPISDAGGAGHHLQVWVKERDA